MTVLRSYLQWPGGKSHIVTALRAFLPPGRRLIEPFVGAGSVFLNANYPEYLLGDANGDLILTHQMLQAHGEAFIEACRDLFVPENNTPDRYYELRDEFNSTADPWRKAILFVYLNRHGFHGLCRYTRNGDFNVSFGYRKTVYFPEEEMRYFAEKAKQATFVCADFRDLLERVEPGDVVYCDPPYVPLSRTSNFTEYAPTRFSWRDHTQLAGYAQALTERGVTVVISNHRRPAVESLYRGAEIHVVEAPRNIVNRYRQATHVIEELIAVFRAL
ncbi:Dam family site-specific DNA-(adenine-N6)-methyltransferase [Alicyclobacillus acidocaldarius]|uniref:Site-specific DNA-methyltransferase (adenine-specific) n=1 Tax=Alicyclobacillus acidocaldarius subsp. acidocaldarius (strain ATCC 27009 / DSM 446 / BCRC 14685 / JCM 5260 / KCTC 1825 / NBRC 15652 / NCIMB 11725 / NRRL B-14509 / 104-IA) TaxID=521098 RepID=C8WST4_ALIAD|nr:Dam family site-specific DNA-(adenine-N6)-methyltransferase [Alicyclobacillus acidocaldarius]ACV57590.1 DNA adenine methylase [Alicyclobacillus acidocaldarius subsp. acidocaldarius DSM 446]